MGIKEGKYMFFDKKTGSGAIATSKAEQEQI